MNSISDQTSDKPAYIRLYRKLAEGITSGAYPFGTKLPSKRTISADTGVSLITVEHAMALLCEEGYAESRQRSGYFVIYKKEDFPGEYVTERKLHYEDLSGIRKSTASFLPYGVLARTMRRVLSDYGEHILVKSPNQGCRELREEICAYLKRSREIYVNPSQIIIGSGAEYLYGLLVQLLGTDEIYGVEDPCYDKIRKVYTRMGAEVEHLRLSPEGISSKALAGSKAKYLHLTPFHSYPSGISVGISKKHEYLRWAKKRGGILIEDNYDSELTVAGKPEASLFSLSDADDVVYINTFSQTVAPSVRIGYMILPPQLEKVFQEKLGFYSCTVPVFDQYVIAELLAGGDFERHINRVRRKRRKEEESGG